MPLVRIESDEQSSGHVSFSVLLDIPTELDMNKEEKVWFAKGGGLPKDFVDHLIAQGAKKVWVPVHVINYM